MFLRSKNETTFKNIWSFLYGELEKIQDGRQQKLFYDKITMSFYNKNQIIFAKIKKIKI